MTTVCRPGTYGTGTAQAGQMLCEESLHKIKQARSGTRVGPALRWIAAPTWARF
jgi:hypothetical protein